MNRVLIDTNVILDLLAKREPFYLDSNQIFSLADMNKVQLVISTLSLANAHYILKDSLKIKQVRSILRKFKVLVESYSLSDKIVELTLNDDDFNDFEDGIQYYTAIEAGCTIIITRNIKDFRKSDLPVLRPREFLTKWKSSNMI